MTSLTPSADSAATPDVHAAARPLPSRLVQVAYRVDDLDTACRAWNAALGLGPFLVRRHMPVSTVHRGEPARYDHSAAFGQWGPVMLELIEVHEAFPESLAAVTGHDVEGQAHHVACFVDDLAGVSGDLQAQGFELAFELVSSSGIPTHFLDTRSLTGGLLELYAPTPHLLRLYDTVRELAETWDGADLIREV